MTQLFREGTPDLHGCACTCRIHEDRLHLIVKLKAHATTRQRRTRAFAGDSIGMHEIRSSMGYG
eukprot:320552-Chlamydomonas_euryale.AAC.40